jgi:hypothetical protein
MNIDTEKLDSNTETLLSYPLFHYSKILSFHVSGTIKKPFKHCFFDTSHEFRDIKFGDHHAHLD